MLENCEVGKFEEIANLINTQDNRATQDPLFTEKACLKYIESHKCKGEKMRSYAISCYDNYEIRLIRKLLGRKNGRHRKRVWLYNCISVYCNSFNYLRGNKGGNLDF